MKTFALITEGITDQVVLSAILTGYYSDEVELRLAQPLRDSTDKTRQGTFAGWENVLQYCTTQLFEQLFSVNEFVILQIDTDVCGHPNFNVPVTIDGNLRSTADIVADVKLHIIAAITSEIYENYRDRIIFAIAVHSLECWLLPLFAKKDADMRRIRKCEENLNQVLNRLNVKYEKTYRIYQNLSRDFFRMKNITHARGKNESLELFISALP
jgi:hypothetical protein